MVIDFDGLVTVNYILVNSLRISLMSIKREERLLSSMVSKVKTVAQILST